jgi:hypothetical protein
MKGNNTMKFSSRVSDGGWNKDDRALGQFNDDRERTPQHPSVAEESSQRSFVEEKDISTECTQVLSKKKRSAHEQKGLDLLPASSINNGRSVSQCGTCLAINQTTLIRNQPK